MLSDLSAQLGLILKCAGIAVGVLGFGCFIFGGIREARAWGRTSRRIGAIGRDQVQGVVERMSMADVRKRAAEARR